MWFRKNKIKETPKRGLYGNRHQLNSNYSAWDSMSFIEKFCFIFMPVMLGFIFYMMCDIIYVDMIWWLRLIISVSGVVLCIGMIVGIVNFFSERY